MRLTDWPLIWKLALISVISLLFLAGVGGFAIQGLSRVAKATDNMDIAAGEIRNGARLSQDVLEINRWEFALVADPHAALERRDQILALGNEVESRIETAQATATPAQQTRLREIGERADAYFDELSQTIAIAEQIGEVERTGGQERLLESSRQSRASVAALREEITAYVTATDQAATAASEHADQTASSTSGWLIAIAILGAITSGVSAYLLGRYQVVRPIRSAIGDLRRLGDGEIEFEVTGTERKDEVGDLNRAILKFQADARERPELIERQEADAKRKLERAQKVKALTEDFQAKVDESMSALAASAQEMEATATSMSSTAEETSAETQSVSAMASQTASSIQTVASATEELSTAIATVSEQIGRTASVSDTASDRVSSAHSRMKDMTAAAGAIDEVATLIVDITNQTKLLALNATIEAARAGEAGKGFAVVAAEVGELADQTEKATADVSKQISAIQRAAEAVGDAIGGIEGVITELNEIATAVASSAEQQVAATGEISESVNQASNGITEASRSLDSLETASQGTASASTQVSSTAEELARRAQSIKGDIDTYLDAVEAA